MNNYNKHVREYYTQRVIAIARGRPETHGTWGRADLSRLTMEKLALERPEIIAACLGGESANVFSGTYGNSGESWTVDTGRNISYSSWEIRPDLNLLIESDQGYKALEIARLEVRSFRFKAHRAVRSLDYAWVRWVLARTPLLAEKLVRDVGWSFPPPAGDYGRAEALAERVVKNHPKLHEAIILAHETTKREKKLRETAIGCDSSRSSSSSQFQPKVETQCKKSDGKSFLAEGAWGALDNLKLK